MPAKIEKDDDRWIADWGVMTGKFEATRFAIQCEDGNVVGPLITTIEELSTGIEVEAPRIITACPFFSNERKLAA